MTKRIILPSRFNISAIYRFTLDIVSPDGRPLSDAFVFDFKHLNFVDGSGYTVLSNTIEWLIDNGVTCQFSNFNDLRQQAISYLDDCGFFHRYLEYSLTRDAHSRSTTLPCSPVAHNRSFEWLEHSLSPWLAYELGVTHSGLASVRTCMGELFNNIIDHSTQHTGFVHVQHYPNARHIKITLSDFGRGIPATIRDRFGEMSDGQAIAHACTDGVTAQSRPTNMGAGLSYLLDTVTSNHGSVGIYSLSGNLNCFRDNKGTVIRRRGSGNGVYPGTLVDISLDTRLFVGDDEERGEVEW